MVSHRLIGKLDMLYCDGIETFVVFWMIMFIRGTIEMSNENYTIQGVYIYIAGRAQSAPSVGHSFKDFMICRRRWKAQKIDA